MVERRTILTAAILLASGMPGAVWAADAQRGKLLYENHCMVCHTSVAHVRAGRIAHSLGDVRKQVLRWSKHLDLQWGSAEVTDVVTYLNQTYYRFEAP